MIKQCLKSVFFKPTEILVLNLYVKERIGYIRKSSCNGYFFLCRLALLRFLRLWVATLCLFLFLPLGIWLFL